MKRAFDNSREFARLRLKPKWANFEVVELVAYLGLVLGHGASSEALHLPVQKWASRAFQSAREGSPAAVAEYMYNKHATPVLSHVSQSAALPISIPGVSSTCRLQHVAIASLFSFPNCALSQSSLLELKHRGGPRFDSVEDSCVVTLIRSALCTLPELQPA
eukprot:4505614-Pyramimonas_sp.AAC.1